MLLWVQIASLLSHMEPLDLTAWAGMLGYLDGTTAECSSGTILTAKGSTALRTCRDTTLFCSICKCTSVTHSALNTIGFISLSWNGFPQILFWRFIRKGLGLIIPLARPSYHTKMNNISNQYYGKSRNCQWRILTNWLDLGICSSLGCSPTFQRNWNMYSWISFIITYWFVALNSCWTLCCHAMWSC